MPSAIKSERSRQGLLDDAKENRAGFAAARDRLLAKQRTGKKLSQADLKRVELLGQLLTVIDDIPAARRLSDQTSG